MNRPAHALSPAAERARSHLTTVAYATFAVYGAALTAVGPTLAPISKEFGVSLGTTGSLFGVGGIGFILVALLAGYLADRLGKRVIILAGILGAGIGLAAQGIAATFVLLLVAAFVVNLGNGLIESSIGGLVVDVHADRRTAALNLLHSFFSWGALLGPLIAGALIVVADWRAVYLVLAIGFLVLLGYVLALRRHFPPPSAEEPIHWREIGPLLRDRTIQLGTAGIFLYVAGELSLSAWSVPYLAEVRGNALLVSSVGVSLFWAMIAVGRTASSWLSARIRPERLIQASAGLCAAGTSILLFAPWLYVSLAGFALAGLGAAAIYPTIMALSTARFPRLSGTVTGLISTATGLGVVIGPTIVGRLGDALGLERALYSVVAAMVAIVLLYTVPARD